MESDDPRTEEVSGEDSRRSNVVRFPREWIRPQEELVPFGVDPSPGLDDVADGQTQVAERPAAADDFWGESSWAIQNPLQGPGAENKAAGSEAAHPDSLFTRARETRLAGVRVAQLVAVAAIALVLLGLLLARLGGSTNAGHMEAKASSEPTARGAASGSGLRGRLPVKPPQTHRLVSTHRAGRHRAAIQHRQATGHEQTGSSDQGARPASDSITSQPADSQAQQASGFSPSPSGGQAQPAGHIATTTSQTHSSPPAGPSGRHALLGPGVCGGCK